MTFEIGDKVVHPAHGAGTIIAINEKRLHDHSNQYYVIFMPAKRFTILLAKEKADEAELRPISQRTVLDKVWEILHTAPETLSNQHAERQDKIKEELGTGNILKIAQALRDLAGREQGRHLTQGDRALLEQAKSFVASEVALARDLEMDEAQRLILAALQPINEES